MRKINVFKVVPSLSERLMALARIARNMWWSWTPEAIDLFRHLDLEGFSIDHNPTAQLGRLSKEKLIDLENNDNFLSHLDRVEVALEAYLADKSWYHQEYPENSACGIAYFSAEFGIHESLPIYSGGLGVLAGDHIKSATDIGLPLTGMGLLYRQGYFRQYLSADGWQQEIYPENDFSNLAMTLEKDEKGDPHTIEVPLPGRSLYAHIWRVEVGRNNLYLLDANIEKNSPEDRAITAQLYGGDLENRIKQEILLGIGGIRALKKLGKKVQVYHMNEGHSAFLALERISSYMQENKLSFDVACQIVKATNVFTTHTPVPAGNDRFDSQMTLHYLKPIQKELGLSNHDFLALGRENSEDDNETFCMTVLALRLAGHCNGVSALHGAVSRNMWRNIWPQVPEEEIPIGHVTNGIHIKSWLSDEISRLFDRYLGPSWRLEHHHKLLAERVSYIPDNELWRAKERLRDRLVTFGRRRLKEQLIRRGASKTEINDTKEILDPDYLTIGFARRFATYKRANLIFQDIERLTSIMSNKERPVQLIFAGKAHPHDNLGKEIIKQIIHVARRDDLRTRFVFIEDYDINVARYMVQGVDVWLNNPRRPKEASGTSGMKGPINGAINLSVLDGWWCEGYNKDNGWAIGSGEEYDDLGYQDHIEAQAILDLLEKEIVPAFYDRGKDGLPHEWIRIMKNSMASVGPVFNTNRMVMEYTQKYYMPAYENSGKFNQENFHDAKTLTKWMQFIKENWASVQVGQLFHEKEGEIVIGEELVVKAVVQLGKLKPEDVLVELVYGNLGSQGQLEKTNNQSMEVSDNQGQGNYLFTTSISSQRSGEHGYAVRVLPKHPNQIRKFEPGFITWG